ncbi:MAG TPA: hypothetical protein PLN21_20585 [Gemmatales bacterium]|nr:hypothetical protein [Gemmatales bacterium]
MLQKKEDADWNRIRTEPRPANQDVFAHGIGQLRMQLIVCPSFEEPVAWEIRQGSDGWKLYRPKVLHPWPNVQLVGYDATPFPSERLASFFHSVTSITMPITPDLTGNIGLDGTIFQIAIHGDMFSSWSFQWWSEPPNQWSSLSNIVSEMLMAFASTVSLMRS